MPLTQFWPEPNDSSASWGLHGLRPAGQIPDSLLRRWEPESQSDSAGCTLTEHLLLLPLLQTRAQVTAYTGLGRSLSDCSWHAYFSLSRRHSRKQCSHISPPKYSSSISCQVPSFPLQRRTCRTPTRHRGSSHLRETKSSDGKCLRGPNSQTFPQKLGRTDKDNPEATVLPEVLL